jgi:hypothetical protein
MCSLILDLLYSYYHAGIALIQYLLLCTAKILYRKFETYIPRKGTARPQSPFFYSHVSMCDLELHGI